MSLLDYRISVELAEKDTSFYALLMAAMRRSDSTNAELLKNAWPDVWAELQARYDAPRGVIEEDGCNCLYDTNDNCPAHP